MDSDLSKKKKEAQKWAMENLRDKKVYCPILRPLQSLHDHKRGRQGEILL